MQSNYIKHLAGIAFFVLATASASAELAETITRIKPSIVGIGTFKATNSPPFMLKGTGFVIGDGNIVATNAHVVSSDAGQDGASQSAQIRSSSAGESQIRPLRLMAIDKVHDLALLRMDGPPVQKLSIRDSGTVKEGQAIAFIGFPIGMVLGFSPVTHRGIISAITPIVLPSPNAQHLNAKSIRQLKEGAFRIFQLDATAYPGNSGSPLFDPDSGEVIGVINMVFVKGTKEAVLSNPSGIAYAIPSNFLSDLLRNTP